MESSELFRDFLAFLDYLFPAPSVVLQIFLIAVTSSADNFTIGATFALARKKLSFMSMNIIAATNTITTFVCMLFGNYLKKYMSTKVTNMLGGAIFIVLGLKELFFLMDHLIRKILVDTSTSVKNRSGLAKDIDGSTERFKHSKITMSREIENAGSGDEGEVDAQTKWLLDDNVDYGSNSDINSYDDKNIKEDINTSEEHIQSISDQDQIMMETGSVKSDISSAKSTKSTTHASKLKSASTESIDDGYSVISSKTSTSGEGSILNIVKESARGLYRTISLEENPKYQYVGLSESVTVSFALCMTNIAGGIAAGIARYPLPLTILLTLLMNYIMTYSGQFIGMNVGQCIPESLVSFIVGILLICIGLEIYLPPW